MPRTKSPEEISRSILVGTVILAGYIGLFAGGIWTIISLWGLATSLPDFGGKLTASLTLVVAVMFFVWLMIALPVEIIIEVRRERTCSSHRWRGNESG